MGPGCPGADRLADPRAGGQPRVPRRVPPRRRVRRPRRHDRRRDRPVTIRRIGFAYNPTSEAAIELRERAAGWCAVRGIDQWAAQAGDFDALCADLPTTDVLVVLGGDGTFLRAARAVIRGRRPAARDQSRQGRLPLEGRGERAGDRAREARRGRVHDRRADGARGPDPAAAAARRTGRRTTRSTTSSSPAARWPGSAGSTSRSGPRTSRRSSPTASSSRARPARPAIRSARAARSSTR